MLMNKIQKTLTFLSKEEAQDVYDRVMSLQDEWILRIPGDLALHTLGIGTFPDKANGSPVYFEKVESNNKMMWENFSDIYEKILDFFNKELGPTRYAPGLALPIFHIFSNKLEDRKEIIEIPEINKQFKIHHDNGHIDQEDYFGNEDLEHITYTLAISLPKRGAGLFVYGEENVDGECSPDSQVYLDLLKTPYDQGEVNEMTLKNNNWADPKFIEYYPGSLVYQIGDVYHQIIIGLDINSHDDRITFQGIGVKKDGEWLLYY